MQEHYLTLCNIINQIHGLEEKTTNLEGVSGLDRRYKRLKSSFEEMNLFIHNPINEKYDETRLDCEAAIVGDSTDNLVIKEVLKPIIYQKTADGNQIIQRAVVIVESK